KQRRAKETQAKTQRSQAPVVNHRADTNTPAFSQPRASHSSGGGGGSLNFLLLLPLAILGLFARRFRKH
ncbi:MAG: hypothetical protein ACPG47_02380, partial [Leucothrix sp.]